MSYCHTVLQKARTWQRQVWSKKFKYEPNLVTFQNKEHYRKKPSLWEVLLVDNYRFSIIFLKSYTRILKSDIAVFICICDEQFLSLPRQTQKQPHRLECQWVQKCAVQSELELSLTESCCFPSKHKMSDNGIYAHCVNTPQANPSMSTFLGSIHKALLFPLWSARFEDLKVNCCN